MRFRVTAVGIAVLLLAPLAHAQDSFVVPSADETVEGDANNTLPFTIMAGSVRYQQVYLDDDIPPAPFTIYGVAFRPDKLQPGFSFEIPAVDIYLGITDATTSPNAEFASNIGSTYTLVASGPLPIASAATGPVDGPLAFDIEIWFDQPFDYSGGNLLLDVFIEPNGASGDQILDAANMAGDAVARVSSAGLTGGSVNATTGDVDTQGLVTKFVLVPEPDGTAMAALAALGALLGSRRRESRDAAR